MEQTNLFEFLNQKFKIDKPIRLIELFAGVGSQAMALKELGYPFEHYKVVEFDKYAIQSYNAIHGTSFIKSDIRQITGKDLDIVNKDEFTYLLTYSFPCQDLSKAGNKRGMSKGSNTRSGLLWEVERILCELNSMDQLPQVLLMENVPDVIGVKNIKDFNLWQTRLEELGYSNYIKVLNAKDFGIPQNRARCFMVSILGDYYYEFPKGVTLKLKLKDFLEKGVDDKYYLSQKNIDHLTDMTNRNGYVRGEKFKPHDETSKYAYTIATQQRTTPTDNYIVEKYPRLYEQAFETIKKNEIEYGDTIDSFNEKVNKSGISPTITTRPEGFKTAILIPEKTKIGYSKACDGDGIYINRPHQKRGVVQKEMIQTLKTSCNDIGVVEKGLRIRKLTPLECWRFMGFSDEDYYKAKSVGMSNTQLYKQAGNSIVKQVLMAIFKKLI